MNNNILFAIDLNTKEIIISNSPRGSNKINFIERIKNQDNNILYDAVVTLTSITNAENFDSSIFRAMDKVCQMIYTKHKEAI
jgi:hypothetical protein